MYLGNIALSSLRVLLLLSLMLVSTAAFAEIAAVDGQVTPQDTAVARLQSMRNTIATLNENQKELNSKIKTAAEDEKLALEEEKKTVEAELTRLNQSFERVATGGVSTEIFGDRETSFNWKDEVVLIVQPIIENLKVLTEKPRKIEQVKSTLELRHKQSVAIQEALESLTQYSDLNLSPEITAKINAIKERWVLRQESNKGAIEATELQLQDLLGTGTSWTVLVRQSFDEFFIGRGLTLFIAIIAAVCVWLLLRAVLWLVTIRGEKSEERRKLTRYRLAAYAYSVLTTILVVITVMVVFYTRGDVLLLGLAILLVAAIIIGLRNTLPRFIAEAKLLLNLGAIREGERVIYNGIPWQVSSINLYSVLRNPKIEGSVRLPLSELNSLTSRPGGNEVWFPHNTGDFLLMESGKLVEVSRITPELVDLKTGGGAVTVMTTSNFYTVDALNLTRNGTFGVASIFGVDYEQQSIALTDVAEAFKSEIRSRLLNTDFHVSVIDILVDLKAAGGSSIDYLIYVTMDSSAARNYFKIERIIQQSCIHTCNINQWNIPFPQMTLHANNFKIEQVK